MTPPDYSRTNLGRVSEQQGSPASGSAAPRRRHLMDPSQPRKPADPEALARLDRVQRGVVSALVITTIFHLVGGLIIAADHVDQHRTDAQVGLVVLAGAFAVTGIAATLAINKRPLVSWWLLLAVPPTVAGLWWVLR